MRKIKTGVFGLNPLLDGGLNEHSTTAVIGGSGAGKTTFAIQYIRKGLESGQEGIFVSLDENKEQIIREAVEMGWEEIMDYLKKDVLVFIDASGKDFSNFIRKELHKFVGDWKGAKARIAIDPLTPVIWAVENHYEQRELLTMLLKMTRKVGTVLCTLEEHGTEGDLSGKETIIPMYLADCVIHLRYKAMEGGQSRMLKIVKCRNSWHSEQFHPYRIINGLGLVVQHETYDGRRKKESNVKLIEALKKSEDSLPENVYKRMQKTFKELSDSELGEISHSELMRYIIEEYS
ncbi:MAG: circadian clock protein KaiC [Thermoplasmata archaeon]|nr:MAG: circadian clock protein KaiC [Thermoplasmata archaeon]